MTGNPATGFGVMHVDEHDRIVSFVEKPKDPPSHYAVTGVYSDNPAVTAQTGDDPSVTGNGSGGYGPAAPDRPPAGTSSLPIARRIS